MTAIIMNTSTGAVTEYDWTFQSVSALHAAGPAGLQTLGGASDAGTPIAASFRGGKPGGGPMQTVAAVFLALSTPGDGELIVQTRTQEWTYPVVARESGVSRAKPGAGIRESYLGFGYRNVAGADFRVDRIEADVTVSKTRRN